jgi:hypothetical protein
MGHVRTRAWPFLVLAVLIAAPLAEAAKRPPRATLHANDQSAKLNAFTYSWTRPTDDGCVEIGADGIPDYSPRIEVAHRHAKPRVLVHRDHRPRVASFRAHRKLNRHGAVAGRGKRVRARVTRKQRGGEFVAWGIAFRVDVVERPYFNLDLEFPGGGGPCSNGGDASYGFGIARE